VPGPSAIAAEVWGAILVGGESRRMGRPKAHLEYGGRSFAARAAAALAGSVTGIVAVGGGELPREVLGLERLVDVPGVRGPLGGILAALRHRRGAAWLIVACDLPLATPAAANWILAQRAADRLAILPRLGATRVEPLFALYEPAAAALLEALAAGGERSLQGLAQEPGVATPTPPLELATAWRNVNSEEDLLALPPPGKARSGD
jgi:molybdopterin-guanine dinucleotide biosynthesis protein A